MTVKLTDNNFRQEVLQEEGVVFVDFWAPWCGPCQMVGPIVEQIADEYRDKVKVGKLNVDENQSIAVQYGVMSIPTMIVFKDGKEVDKLIGAVPKKAIEDKLKQHIA